MFTLTAGIPSMNEAELRKFGGFIEREFGIKMPATKKSLLESRLFKRVQACGLSSYSGYFDFVTKDPKARDEFLRFVDLVSTHETSFFREERHFNFLRETVLPALCREEGRRAISVLSAACSTGEEAYSLGMLVNAAVQDHRRSDISFTVEGVDLSNRAIAMAQRGVYLAESTEKIPDELRRRYLMVSRDRSKDLCRIVPELRRRMSFHTGNLLGKPELESHRYDIVFCRNVLIYFNQANQRQAVATLLDHMASGGFLFLGHSESIMGFDLPASIVSHAVFRKD
jgi:chemotaxis protein methyltransferase CheR